jgi:lipopolysaccharide export system protein LptA
MKQFNLLLTILLCLSTSSMFAQVPVNNAAADTSSKEIIIEKADIFRRVITDSSKELIMLIGNVVMRQGKTLFTCDSAVRNISNHEVEAFGNVHINDGDSVNTYSQYLKYLELTKMAYLKNKVKLTDGKGVLTTNELQYDLNTKIGTYSAGGKVVNGKTELTSKEGVYYAEKREAYFISKVKLNDPEYKVSTDTLLYDINNSIAHFIAPTNIYDGQSNIKTKAGFYDMKNGLANFGSRPIIQDSSQQIIADIVNYDKKTGDGFAEGKVVYTDTAQGLSVLAGDIRFNSKSNQVLASKKPTMIIKQNKDSIYIAGDTLFSATTVSKRAMDTTKSIKGNAKLKSQNNLPLNDTIRYFKAYHHVKIFSDSLQGTCDSLYYSNLDSSISMFTDPVLWTKNNQLTGDTIILYTKNQQPYRCNVFDNSFAVSRTKENFYNQLKGTQMVTQFVNGEIDFIRTKGSAESVYYLQDDDSAYFGMNYSMADAITLYFDTTGLKKVSWVNAVEGTTYPMLQIPEDKKILRSFRWLEARRPKTKWELINR